MEDNSENEGKNNEYCKIPSDMSVGYRQAQFGETDWEALCCVAAEHDERNSSI